MPELYNWGNCIRPTCNFQSSRCAHGYCSACCHRDHQLLSHFRPWAPDAERDPSNAVPIGFKTNDMRIVPQQHSALCMCDTCSANAKARREADEKHLPAIYQPTPVEPKLGDMTEQHPDDKNTDLDWPLKREYEKAKTVYYYGGQVVQAEWLGD